MDREAKLYTVYKHTSPSGKVYIGITSLKPEARWKAGYKGCRAFFNAIQKYGWENIRHEIVATGLSYTEACEMEIRLITEYDSTNPKYGYNISHGGSATQCGLPVSEETRKKLSKANKAAWSNDEYHRLHSGENTYWYGRHHSAESLQKIKNNHADQRGKNHPMHGKHHTAESREKMSTAKVGKYTGANNWHAKPVLQLDCDGNVVAEYGCIKDACVATRANGSNIKKVILGQRKTAGGYGWELKEVA